MTNDRFDAPMRAEVEEKLRIRAWKDKAFRQELLANTNAVLEREYPELFENGKAAKSLTYKVIEEDQKTQYIVLPVLSDGPFEIEDSNLEKVTGGMGIKRPRETVFKTNPFCDHKDC